MFLSVVESAGVLRGVVGLLQSEISARLMYCKCSACNESVVAAMGRMRDHYAGCKKRPRSIGVLDEWA